MCINRWRCKETRHLPSCICNLKSHFSFRCPTSSSIISSLSAALHVTYLKQESCEYQVRNKRNKLRLNKTCRLECRVVCYCIQTITLAICCSYGSVSNSKAIKNSRLVSQKDDVHVCIMCLRAIMNYQVLLLTLHVQETESRRYSDIFHVWRECVSCTADFFSNHILLSHLHAVRLQYGHVSRTCSQWNCSQLEQ